MAIFTNKKTRAKGLGFSYRFLCSRRFSFWYSGAICH